MSDDETQRRVQELIEKLKDKDADVRRNASWELEMIGEKASPAAISTLIEALGDENMEVRCWAAEALGMAREKASPAISTLIEALGDKECLVRLHTAAALKKIGEKAVPDLTKALKKESARVRSGAAELLGEMGAAVAVPALIERLNDDEKDVREKAGEAIVKIGPGALPNLHQAALEKLGMREKIQKVIDGIASKTERPSGVRRVDARPDEFEWIMKSMHGAALDINRHGNIVVR